MSYIANKLKDPFFIFYDSRSGSTFLAKTLTKYAKVAMPPETNFITALIDNYKRTDIKTPKDLEEALKITFADKKFEDWALSIEEINEFLQGKLPITLADFIKSILFLYKEKFIPQAEYVGIKKNYVFYLKKLKKLFPGLKVVSMIRDGRAVFKSKKNSIYSVTGKPFETNPARAARTWADEIKITNYLIKQHKEIKKFYFEELIKNTEATIQEILDFLGIEEDKENATNYYVVPERYGKLHDNVAKKSDKSKIADFKEQLTPEEIEAFESIAGKYLEKEGYELIKVKHPSWLTWLRSAIKYRAL